MFSLFFWPDRFTDKNLAVKVYLAETRSSLSLLNYTRRVQSVSRSHICRASPSLLVVYHPMSAEPTADKQVEETSRRGWLGAKRQMARSLEEDNRREVGGKEERRFYRGEFGFFLVVSCCEVIWPRQISSPQHPLSE